MTTIKRFFPVSKVQFWALCVLKQQQRQEKYYSNQKLREGVEEEQLREIIPFIKELGIDIFFWFEFDEIHYNVPNVQPKPPSDGNFPTEITIWSDMAIVAFLIFQLENGIVRDTIPVYRDMFDKRENIKTKLLHYLRVFALPWRVNLYFYNNNVEFIANKGIPSVEY